jgi:hypothetical protein
MTKKKCALVLITGDRVDYIDSSIKSCLNFINKYNIDIETDIYLICFDGVKVVSSNNIKTLSFNRPTIDSDIILNFPKSIQQVNNYSNDIELTKRISLGHLILFGLVPDTISKNKDIFIQYDYILKSRADLVFDFSENDILNFNINNQLLTFECFWGGCRYNKNFTNDHFVFGESSDVLKLISFPISDCIIDKFWNPEQYMTYLFSKSNKEKIEISTDKYYLLSKDRDSRKWIGFPLEKINKNDILFLEGIGIDVNKIKFTNEYEN